MNLSVVFSFVAYFVLILSLVVGFFVGLKRGLVKSSLRFGLLIAFLIVGGLITMPISNAISKIDITSFNWVVNEKVATTIPEGLRELILSNEQFAAAAAKMPSLMELANVLPAAIISIAVFFILVPIMLLLSYIIYVILAKFALPEGRLERQAKKLQKAAKKSKLENTQISQTLPNPIIAKKKNKKKWLGAAVGTLCGFIFIFVLMLPITSLTSTISDIAAQPTTVAAETEEKNFLSESSSDLIRYYIGDEVISYIDGYSQSVAGKILTLGGLDNAIFDSITSVKINNEKFAFRNDIYNAAKAYDEFVFIVDFVGKEGTFKTIDFKRIDNIVDRLFNTGLFKAFAPELIPYAVDYLRDLEAFKNFEYNAEISLILDGVVNNLNNAGKDYVKTLRSDFSNLIEIGQTACKVGLVDDIVGGKRDIPTFIKSLKAENYALLNSLTKNLINSPSFKVVITKGATAALNVVEKKLNSEVQLGEIDENKIEWKILEPELNSFIKNAVDAFLILDKYDFEKISENPKFITSTEFETVDFDALLTILGKELNILKNSNLTKNQNVNAYNEIASYMETNEKTSNYFDAKTLKEIDWENELNNIKSSLIALKESGALNYALETEDFNIDNFLILLSKEDTNHNTYAKLAIKPILSSKLSTKPIKHFLEKFNEQIPALKERFGEEIVEINLSSYSGLSENDREELSTSLELATILASKLGLMNFKDQTFETIFKLNDYSSSTVNSTYLTNFLTHLAKIEITRETYKSLFTAAGNNEKYNTYLYLGNAAKDDFDWNAEFEKINKILTVLKKEKDGNSIKTILFPNNKLETIEINEETLSKMFNVLSSPLIETMPENSCMKVLVVSLYDSSLLKQSLVYLINTLNSRVCEQISSTEKTFTVGKIKLENLTENQKLQIVNVFDSITKAFNILTKADFSLDTLTDEEIVKVGTFLNTLKENAYNYVNGSPSVNCQLSEDGTSVKNGGVFASLYIAMIDYAKQTYEFSGNISYGEIEWISFLRTAKKLSELSGSDKTILDIISDKDSNVDVSKTLEIIGVESQTTEKISSVQDSFKDIDSSNPDSFENLANELDKISSTDAENIENAVKETTGKDITGAVDMAIIANEKAISARISLLMRSTLTDENEAESLAILCNGATVVLSEAVSSGVVLQCNITGGLSALETKINAQTSSDAVRSLVKALFGIM